jgi:hypothetical protein
MPIINSEKRACLLGFRLQRLVYWLAMPRCAPHIDHRTKPGGDQVEGSTSGARGLRSGGGGVSSLWDLRLEAFSTSAATSLGSDVDWANLRSVLT